jgi:small subunit ribosomal protein S3
MGHKVNPIGFRLGICEDWQSRWFAKKQDFGKFLVQDARMRNFIKKNYRSAAISRIEIERTGEDTRVTLFTARPGIVIGRKGTEVDRMREKLEGVCGQKVAINIKEVERPELDAQLIGEGIAEEVEKRASYKRAMKKSAELAMQSGAEGVRIRVAGRLGGAEIARSEEVRMGKVPLHTLRVRIGYGTTEAVTTYGNIGIKVWLYQGGQEEKQEAVQHGVDAQTS